MEPEQEKNEQENLSMDDLPKSAWSTEYGKVDMDLFDNLEDTACKMEWKGMPEFVQDKQEPFCLITMRFRNKEDLLKFGELIQQTVTTQTKSLWYPAIERGLYGNYIWTDDGTATEKDFELKKKSETDSENNAT
jgi:hypothetical protein